MGYSLVTLTFVFRLGWDYAENSAGRLRLSIHINRPTLVKIYIYVKGMPEFTAILVLYFIRVAVITAALASCKCKSSKLGMVTLDMNGMFSKVSSTAAHPLVKGCSSSLLTTKSPFNTWSDAEPQNLA